MSHPYLSLLAAVFFLTVTSRLPAADISGRTIPDQATIAEAEVPLRGADLLKYKWVISLYVAGLYLPKAIEATPAAAVAATPKRLLMHYVRDIPREKMVEATDETIGNGLTPEQVTAIAASQKTWNALYPAPRENDVLTFDHLTGGTLIMTLNGKEVGRLTDDAFARALFAIWIGDQPVKKSLRDTLIGKD